MEYSQPLDSGMYAGGLELETAAREYLRESAKWAKFLSIVGFVMIGFMVIAAFFVGAMFSTMGNFQGIDGADELAGLGMLSGGFITAMYLAFAALYFFPTLYFYRFSTKTKLAIESGSSTDLTAGLENLKSCFKFWGIFMIVILGIYALFFVIGIAGAAFAGLS
ncbi:MAG: hypothetical protein AB8G22_28540 [Saprospiraceae bacterium]